MSRSSWYDDLGYRGRGRRLGRHLGFGCLLRGPGKVLGLEWRIANRAPTVRVVEPFRTPIPPCARTLYPPFCADPSRRNFSLSLSRRQNQAPLRNRVKEFPTLLRNDRRLTKPVCVNGGHLRHVFLGSKDKFMIDDICWGVCGVATLGGQKTRGGHENLHPSP